MELIGPEHIERARGLLDGVSRQTPVATSRILGRQCGGPVYLKCENLQRTGSFKLRGGYVRLHGLADEQRRNGVVAASAGNHAQGVALAASLLGVHATVFMPARAPLPKVDATSSYGADVRLEGMALEDALDAAEEFAVSTGGVLIHPFEHADIIAGQATVGLEILEQVPEVRTIVVAAGGGGLAGGIAAAVKDRRPDVRVVAVQAEGAAAWPPSLAAGRPVRLPRMHTMADGIAVGEPGPLTYAHMSQLVDDVLTVGEEALSRALLLCLERSKMVVEPAGVAPVAAMLDHRGELATPAVAVLSGGNIDPLLMLHLVQHGLTVASRYLTLRVRIPDRPGSLAMLLSRVGELGANILDVEHSRISGALAIGEVDVELNLETRGTQHCEDLTTELRSAGYSVSTGS